MPRWRIYVAPHSRDRGGLWGFSLIFGLSVVPLPFRDREEDSTARWVDCESPLRPAAALSFIGGDVGGDAGGDVGGFGGGGDGTGGGCHANAGGDVNGGDVGGGDRYFLANFASPNLYLLFFLSLS